MKFGIFLILNFDTLGSEKVKIQKRGLLTENVSGGSETTASNTQRNMKKSHAPNTVYSIIPGAIIYSFELFNKKKCHHRDSRHECRARDYNYILSVTSQSEILR